MNTVTPNGIVTDMAGLRARAGTHLGYSEWAEMTQKLVNEFADLTGDRNYIHVDVERARKSPFGSTIAHGYLTLSLLAPVTQQLLQVTDARTSINYGLERLRFPASVPVGAYWRGGAELVDVDELKDSVQAKVKVTVEVKGSEKPALVAECLFRYYG